MRLHGTAVLAGADRHHLEEPRADVAREAGMGLHPVDHADPVGLRRVAVQPDRQAQRLPDLDDVHRRADGQPIVASVTP